MQPLTAMYNFENKGTIRAEASGEGQDSAEPPRMPQRCRIRAWTKRVMSGFRGWSSRGIVVPRNLAWTMCVSCRRVHALCEAHLSWGYGAGF